MPPSPGRGAAPPLALVVLAAWLSLAGAAVPARPAVKVATVVSGRLRVTVEFTPVTRESGKLGGACATQLPRVEGRRTSRATPA